MGTAKKDIVALMTKCKDCEDVIETLQESICKYEDNIKHILHTLLPEVEEPFHLHLGKWECADSPTDQCVYHDFTDPAHDCCVFCGDPSERK